MPARDATEDAVALLEKRRAQNRQAQARFRQKKLAQQAAAAAAAGSSSGSSSSPSAADATNGKRRRASPPAAAAGAQPQVVYRGGSTSSESGYVGNSSTSPSSSRSGPESDKASSPSTSSSSTSPSSGSSSALSPSSYFASLPTASVQPPSSGLPVFSYPEAAPKPPSTLDGTTACPYAGIDLSLPGALPLPADRTTYASYDDYLGDTISSSSAMPVDNEVQYFACVMREAEEEQRKERERKEMLLQRQQMMLQQFPQRQAGGGMAYGGLDDLLKDFAVGTGTGTGTTLAPGLLEQGAASSGTGYFDQQQQAQQPQPQPPQPQQPQPSSFSGMDLSFTGLTPWQITEQLTQEKGMLAMALLQSGAPNIEQLRKAVLDPSRSMKFNESHVMAKAFFHNAVTLGFLDSDLRAHHAQSNIADVWKARSVPFVVAPSMGGGGLTVLNGSSAAISPRSLAAPGTLTKTSDELWRMPIALSQTDEERRIDRLRDAPNMFPTALQLTRPHSMIVDVLPWPSVRDGLIRLLDLGIVDSHTLKCDLLGKPFDCQGDGRTFIIHGNDPLDPEAWEMSEYWAQKYVPLLDRAMVRRTNFWRRMEGKEPLRLDVDREEGVDRSIIDALAKLNMAGGGGGAPMTTTMGPMATSLCV